MRIINGAPTNRPESEVLASLRSKGWTIDKVDPCKESGLDLYKVKGHRWEYFLEGLCVLDHYPDRWQPKE